MKSHSNEAQNSTVISYKKKENKKLSETLILFHERPQIIIELLKHFKQGCQDKSPTILFTAAPILYFEFNSPPQTACEPLRTTSRAAPRYVRASDRNNYATVIAFWHNPHRLSRNHHRRWRRHRFRVAAPCLRTRSQPLRNRHCLSDRTRSALVVTVVVDTAF